MHTLPRLFTSLSLLLMSVCFLGAQQRTVNLRILETTDVHGNFFPYNFITRQPWGGSLARVSTYVDSLRMAVGPENVITLDNGDLLQGQPTVYYYNFIDTSSPHIADEVFRFIGYDAATIGNHDIETGHDVYDRVVAQAPMEILGANVIEKASGKPYFKPYTVIERDGAKVAVLGLLTAAIPAWLPETLWEGLEFEDMEESARKWIDIIRRDENLDVIIGLFHSGADINKKAGPYVENASLQIARRVPGFDAVLYGHDHRRYEEMVINTEGKPVVVLNPANNAMAVADLDVTLTYDGNKLVDKKVKGRIADVENLEPNPAYMARFAPQYQAVEKFTTQRIGNARGEFSTRDAFFGPSAFMSLLHRLQLEISGADISFAAPLSFDARIAPGSVTMSDMFTLYKYENMLYTMEMTGQEILDYLEMSYDLWINTLDGRKGEHLIKFAEVNPTPQNNYLKNPSYNFDSAAGINYTVDVSKPKGKRIKISRLSDGRKFNLKDRYKVAMNSYRANGGGNHLTEGAGIPASELPRRVVNATDKDLRYYLIERIEKEGDIVPTVDNNWQFVPEKYVAPAVALDRQILFSPLSSTNQK